MKYVMGNFETRGMGAGIDFNAILQGDLSSVGTFLTSEAYKLAMNEVSKYGNIVKSFSSKAVAAANAVNRQVSVIQTATSKEQADAAIAEMKKQAGLASAEAANAAKNYTLTVTALNALMTVKGIPSAVVDSAKAILASAKKSMDTASQAAASANNTSGSVQDSYTGSNFGPSFSPTVFGGSNYMKYAMIAGGALVGIVGLVFLVKAIKNRKK